MMRKYFWFLLLPALLLAGCKDKVKDDQLLPNVTGKAGEVVLVINGDEWDNSVGYEFRKKLTVAHPALPQIEPLFDLVHIPYSAFNNIFKTHRNLILAKVSSDYEEPKILLQRNVHSKPQFVANVIAPDDSSMARLLREKGDLLVHKLLEAERERHMKNYKKYEAKGLQQAMKKKFNASLILPAGYKLVVDTTNFQWFEYETPEVTSGVFLYSYPHDAPVFSTDLLAEKRNEFTKKYVPGGPAGSYVTIEKRLDPYLRKVAIDDETMLEMRGLWRVEKDFMGGPFISLSVYDTINRRVVTADGFVYAPQFDKRDYLRQVEAAVYSLTLNQEGNNESAD